MISMIQCYYYAVVYLDKDGNTLLRTFIAAETDLDASAIVEARAPENAARYQYGKANVQHGQSGIIDKDLAQGTLRDMLNGLNQEEAEALKIEKEAKGPRAVA